MAYLEKQPGRKKPWRVRYQGPDGRMRSRSFAVRPEAARFRATVEADIGRGEWVDPRLGKTRFEDWATRWMDSAVHLKPKTRAGYESMLRAHLLPTFGHRALAAIHPLEIQEWIARVRKRGLSASRIRAGYYLLSTMFKAAVHAQYIARSPCVGVKLPRLPRNEMLFLTVEQVDRLADAVAVIEERSTAPGVVRSRRLAAERALAMRTLVYVFAYGGLRWGELAGLRRKHCAQLGGSRIHVRESMAEVSGRIYYGPTKTYQERTVVLPAFVRELLTEHLRAIPDDANALVFTAPAGGPLRHANFRRRVWRPALRIAGLPEALRIHDLRHTCAAILIARNLAPKVIQRHLGHSSIQVTLDRYGHLMPGEMDHVGAAMQEAWQAAQPEPASDGGPSVISLSDSKARRGRRR